MKDYFDLPSIVIGQHGKGSGRSVKGFNLGKALIEATEAGLLLKGGGHAAAAGLTIDESKIDQFRDFLIEKTRDLDQHRVPVNVDLVISPGALQLPHIEEFMSTMEPFGMSNTKPRVVIHRGLVVECRVMANNSMKVVLQGENNLTSHIMLWKNTPDKFKEAFIENEGEVVDVLAVPSINDYGGRKTVQYTLEDVMVPERKQNRLYQ